MCQLEPEYQLLMDQLEPDSQFPMFLLEIGKESRLTFMWTVFQAWQCHIELLLEYAYTGQSIAENRQK